MQASACKLKWSTRNRLLSFIWKTVTIGILAGQIGGHGGDTLLRIRSRQRPGRSNDIECYDLIHSIFFLLRNIADHRRFECILVGSNGLGDPMAESLPFGKRTEVSDSVFLS